MLRPLHEADTTTKEIGLAFRHSLVYGGGIMAAKAIGFLLLPFYTHYLDPRDYGIWELLEASMCLLGMFLDMGITAAVARFYAAAETPESKRAVVSTALVFVAVTASFAFFVGLVFVRHVSALLFGPAVPATYLSLSFLSFIISYSSSVPRAYIRVQQAASTYVAIDVFGILLLTLLNIYFVGFLRIGLLGVLWSPIISFGFQAVFLTHRTIGEVGLGVCYRKLREMLVFGLPLTVSNFSYFALNLADRFFLQRFGSLEAVGIYAVGYKFGYLISYLFVQPFFLMWQTRMYLVQQRSDHRRIFRQLFLLYSFLLTFAGLGLSLWSEDIIRLMVSSKFYASQEVVPLIVLSYVFLGIGYYTQLGMFLASRTSLISIVNAIAAILNLGLNYVLIPRYGIFGAALATVVGFLAIVLGSYGASERVFPLRLALGRVFGGILLALGLYLLSRGTAPAASGAGLLLKLVLLASFPALLYATGILPREEVSILSSWGGRAGTGAKRLLHAFSGWVEGLPNIEGK